MKSIFSQFFKSSLLNRVMRLIIVVVCFSYSAAANKSDFIFCSCKAGGTILWASGDLDYGISF